MSFLKKVKRKNEKRLEFYAFLEVSDVHKVKHTLLKNVKKFCKSHKGNYVNFKESHNKDTLTIDIKYFGNDFKVCVDRTQVNVTLVLAGDFDLVDQTYIFKESINEIFQDIFAQKVYLTAKSYSMNRYGLLLNKLNIFRLKVKSIFQRNSGISILGTGDTFLFEQSGLKLEFSKYTNTQDNIVDFDRNFKSLTQLTTSDF